MNLRALSTLFSSSTLEQYRGRYIAIDVGTAKIVDSSDDLFNLISKLKERGIKLNKVIVEYVPEKKLDTII